MMFFNAANAKHAKFRETHENLLNVSFYQKVCFYSRIQQPDRSGSGVARVGIATAGGNVPYVSSSQMNNGISGFVDEEPSHAANTLTVARNGSVASTFYQPIDYCASPDDGRILHPKFNMNQYLGLFLAVLIEKEKYRYDYGRKFGTKRMKETLLKLPAKPDGNPDWQFIENYIKGLPYSGNL